MKKLCLIFIIFSLFVFAGCGSSKTTDDTDSGEAQNDEDSVDAETDDSYVPDDTEPTEEPDQEDTDTEPEEEEGLCNPNPCEDIANSTGICTVKEAQYLCECDTDYEWNGLSCVRSVPLSLGNICTGQTECYDMTSLMECPSSSEADFYGQDQHYAALGYCTPQSFTATQDVVVDNNTGLIWEKSSSSDTYIWEEAQNHCNDLNEEAFAGIDSWRVPNPLELLTLVDNSTSRPAVNQNFKKMVVAVWTSKFYEKESGSSAYSFNPYYGTVSSTEKAEPLRVLCVSGEEMLAAQESDFEVSEDEMTVTDKRTGLVWEKTYHTDMDWKAMLAYCQSLNTGTETGWRLPNKNEIASLLDPDKDRPYSNFPGMSYDYCLWSSTTFVHFTDSAWEICRGYVAQYHKDFENNEFRCVK